LKEFTLKILVDFQVLPTFLAEGVAKKQVISSFLNIIAAQNTVVVISLQFVLFLLRMFLVFSLSMSRSQENTPSLLQPFEFQI
jgi:hypothetical protein